MSAPILKLPLCVYFRTHREGESDFLMSSNAARAKAIATYAHEGQTRRDGTPYITHCEAVAAGVGWRGADFETVGWLHDVLEDAPWCGRDIAVFFPDGIVDAVTSITKWEGQSHEEYVQACASNRLARAVKLVDMAINLGGAPKPEAKERYLRDLKTLGQRERAERQT